MFYKLRFLFVGLVAMLAGWWFLWDGVFVIGAISCSFGTIRASAMLYKQQRSLKTVTAPSPVVAKSAAMSPAEFILRVSEALSLYDGAREALVNTRKVTFLMKDGSVVDFNISGQKDVSDKNRTLRLKSRPAAVPEPVFAGPPPLSDAELASMDRVH